MNIDIYIDGACRGNGKQDSIGGYGIFCEELDWNKYDGVAGTTNNIMELTAAIVCLEEVIKFIYPLKITSSSVPEFTIYTDSNYVCKGLNEWIHNWKIKQYKDVKNSELWKKLDKYNQYIKNQTNIKFVWVKAHNGNFGNEQADTLANMGCDLVK